MVHSRTIRQLNTMVQYYQQKSKKNFQNSDKIFGFQKLCYYPKFLDFLKSFQLTAPKIGGLKIFGEKFRRFLLVGLSPGNRILRIYSLLNPDTKFHSHSFYFKCNNHTKQSIFLNKACDI